ncbi:MAG: hypothetical protein WD873_02290 [Candidatus Hydrogenedentales bacterium]
MNTSVPMRLLLTLTFVFPARAATATDESNPASWPPTIALLNPVRADFDGAALPPRALVLAVYRDGAWTSADLESLVPTDYEGNQKALTDEETERTQRLLATTFYDPVDSARRFHPSATCAYWVIASPYLGLTGSVAGFENAPPRTEGFLVTSRPQSLPPLVPLTLVDKSNLARVVHDPVVVAARKASQSTQRFRSNYVQFRPDLDLYSAPEIRNAVSFEISTERKGVWVYAASTYPMDLAPDPGVPDFPMWSVDYYGLLEAASDGTYRVLWETITVLDDPWSRRGFDFLGVCDGDGDGVAEVVLYEHRHEYRSFLTLAYSSGRYEIVSTRSGAI